MTRLGLCCIHVGLQAEGNKFQTMTWTRFKELGKEVALPILAARYRNNIKIIYRILQICAQNNWCYRISSDIFPLMTHKDADIKWEDLPNVKELDELLAKCAKEIYTSNIRVSCHPDQFNVLASENQRAVEQTIIELNHHGWFMSKFSPDGYDAPINIHLNCSKGDPAEIAKRFKTNLDRLNAPAKSRLVVEVEDKGIWNAKSLVEHIHGLTGIPITFDYLHHKCNDGGIDEQQAFEMCYKTWGSHRPLFHFSETLPGQKNPRKHADYPTFTPNRYGMEVDLDYEFKMKDLALKKAQEMAKQVDDELVAA